MRLSPLSLCSVLAFLTVNVGSASAQYTPISPFSQPRVSPYLNLLRQGTAPGINYYGLVRPEIDFRTGIQQLGAQGIANQQAINALQNTTGALTTGHAFGFQNHQGYFQNLGAGGQGTPGFGLGGTTQPAGGKVGGQQPATGGTRR
jgi:hypothetical protein